MRKIILVSLFFCLSITTVLAQVATINIATPNSNGLSNNQVDDFDVNTDGTILNNSATGWHSPARKYSGWLAIAISQQVAKQILFYSK